MKIYHSSMVPDIGRLSKEARRTAGELGRDNLEITMRFSWLDVILAAAGIVAVMTVVCKIKKAVKKASIRREAKKLAKEAEENDE